MDNQQEKLLISAAEAATMIGVGRTLFYELNTSGRLGPMPVRLGRRTLWRKAELAEWVESGCPVREKWITQNEK